MEQSIEQDLRFLAALYQRYPYLQDFPCEFKAMFLENASSLGILHSDSFLGVLLGYPVEDEESQHDRPYLPVEVNRKLCKYRHLTPVQPWPQPTIGMAMVGEQGRVTGVHGVPVVLRRVGNAQVWFGGEVGLIFECFLEGQVQEDQQFESLMNQLWSLVEEFLQEQGVAQIYTLARDPALDEAWFRGHLERRGYQPLSPGAVTWVKG